MKKINIPFMNAIEERGISLGTMFKSVLISYVISLVLLALFAVVLTYTSFPENSISTVALIVSIISILYAAKMSAKKAKNRGWLIGAVTGLIYMLILYLISLVFTKRPVFDSHVLFIFAIGFFAGAVGGVIGINLKKGEKKHR